MTDVQLSADGWRRGINGKDLFFLSILILVNLIFFPHSFQFLFRFPEIVLLIHLDTSYKIELFYKTDKKIALSKRLGRIHVRGTT